MTDGMTGTRLGAMFSLAGRTALVTGAGRGLGRGIAEALAAAGANVVCADRAPGNATDTAGAIRALGRTAWELYADLTDRAALLALATEAELATGGIDILVNCGGTIARYPAAEYPDDAWDLVMRTNLDGTFLLCRSIGAAMLARGRGKIINIASLLAFQGGITVPATRRASMRWPGSPRHSPTSGPAGVCW